MVDLGVKCQVTYSLSLSLSLTARLVYKKSGKCLLPQSHLKAPDAICALYSTRRIAFQQTQ